jgi:hypothetical protein
MDSAAKLIAYNRELLALAAETREATQAAIERAAEVLQITREVRPAQALLRRALADRRVRLRRRRVGGDLP